MEPFIVHSHIPKTGGSALNRRLLFPMYGEDRVYQMYRYVFETASRLPRRHVARAMRSFIAVGHVPFGYFDELYPDAVYVSVFREPVARFISFLNFVLANPDHAVRERLDPNVLINAANDPDAFISAVLAEPRLAVVHPNTQVRLAGGSPRLGECPVTLDHLEAALRNLSRGRYISGVQEDMPALIARFQERFPNARIRDPGSAKLEKRLHKSLRFNDLRPSTVDALRAANDLDLRFYAVLCDAHEDRLATAA
jgi:hypothetical protein